MKHFMPCLYSVKNLLFRPLGNLLSEQSQCLVDISSSARQAKAYSRTASSRPI